MQVHNIKTYHCIPLIKEKYVNELTKLFTDSSPHAVIFDLEDSVHPNEKEHARTIFTDNHADILETCKAYGVVPGLRINSLNTQWHSADLEFLAEYNFSFVDVPKVEQREDIEAVREVMPDISIAACVETIVGMHNLEDICQSLDNKKDVLFVGHEDTCADYLIERPMDLGSFHPLSYFMMNCVTYARKYGLVVIDGPSREYREEFIENFFRECQIELSWGFDGKITIHPRQIEYVNDIFSNKKKAEHAANIIKKFDDLDDGSTVAVNEKGDMMDMPSLRMATQMKKNITM